MFEKIANNCSNPKEQSRNRTNLHFKTKLMVQKASNPNNFRW